MLLLGSALWSVSAQLGFFPSKKGLTLLYANTDAKGKTDIYTRQTVTDVTGSGANMTISYLSEALDKNQKSMIPEGVRCTITVTDGVAEMDMKSMVTPSIQNHVTIEGDQIRIPSTLSPGDKLSDAHYTMTINMGLKLKTEMTITEHQCVAIEDVTVPEGTFKCHKMTQTSTATVMRKTTTTKTLTWYVSGIGMVKSETYDDKGKLQGSLVLQSVSE